jgi:hypothetical protein
MKLCVFIHWTNGQEWGDLPQTQDLTRQMTFPWSAAHRWWSTQDHLLEGAVWIYGFWTGLNYVAAASDQTQAKIDLALIVAEVEKTCAQQTSQTLASAV